MSTAGFFDGKATSARVSQRLVTNAFYAQAASIDTITNTLFQEVVPGKGVLYQVIGYAPTQFATAPISSEYYLNALPGMAQAALVTTPGLLILPTGAQVLSAKATNDGVTVDSVGGTFNIGLEVFTSPVGFGTELFSALPVASLNLPNGSSVDNTGLIPALGTAGSSVPPLAATAANTCVSVQNTAAVTAGSMAVLITYLL